MVIAAKEGSKRQLLFSGIELVQSVLLTRLQKVEDYLHASLVDDTLMTQPVEGYARPPLNFDESSEDDSVMAFDQRPQSRKSSGSENDNVPQSPPSSLVELNGYKNADMTKTTKESSLVEEKKEEEEEEVFDPMNTLETVFTNLTSRVVENRNLLRTGAQLIVYGNILLFVCLYCSKSLHIMLEQHSFVFNFFYSAVLLVSIVHAVFTFEKTRRTDAGTPEKITLAHGATPNPATAFTIEELRNFSPAFRNLLGHRDKGYVSLMHVQAQFSQAAQLPSFDYSSTDEESSVTLGGLRICEECTHMPIKPLRTMHCNVCEQDTILSDGHSYLTDNCIGINNRRYYLMFHSTVTFLMVAVIYPLSLLDITPAAGLTIRLLASSQLISALFGAILCLVYTSFLWYTALTGLYQVDTYSGHLIKETPRKKLARASNMTLKEQILILFGTKDPLEILDSWQYDSRPLPLKGLEWTFLQSVGGISTSDEEEEFEKML